MSRARSILMVVEGQKAEPRLLRRALSVYGVTDVDEVYPYGANIYDLYRRMFQDVQDVEDLDLIQVLKERETDPHIRNLLDRNYSDILLVFDFDPQDQLFSVDKLQRMIDFFDESTYHGKLYVNYPMVESYRDFSVLPYDEGYMGRSVSLADLKSGAYKDMVGMRSVFPQLDECNVFMFNQVLLQNVEKASSLVGEGYDEASPLCRYDKLTQQSIVDAESRLLEGAGIVSVLCTCLWFVIDYGPRRLAKYLQQSATR